MFLGVKPTPYPKGLGHQRLRIFNFRDLHALTVIARDTKFDMMTYHDQSMNSKRQAPQNSIFETYSIYTQKSLNIDPK